MNEIQALTGVLEFHKKFDAYIGESPEIPNSKVCDLRINLLQEELNELKEAINNNDIVEAADALMDLQYVLSGAIISFGLQNIASDLFKEVQRSNMSKLCKNIEEAQETVKFHEKKGGLGCYIIDLDNGQFSVKRLEDNKQLKSINYSPCNLKPIIENETH